MKVAKVKNWDKFQHYKNRCPPWIKLSRGLIDDFEFTSLPVASKALAPLLWLLASESDDASVRIDADYLAYRLRWTVDDVLAGLIPLIDKGFLEVASDVLAECLQDARPEGETEGEGETELPNPNGLGVGFFESNEPPADKGIPQGATDDAQAVTKRDVCPVAKIVALYHENLPKHPRVEKITPGRAGNIRARWREDLPTLNAWKNYFQDIAKSRFLTGRIDAGPGKSRPFIADLEWITKSGNFAKIAEGRYHE